MREQVQILADYFPRPVAAVLADVGELGQIVLDIDGKRFDFHDAYRFNWKICGGGRLAGSWRRRFQEMDTKK